LEVFDNPFDLSVVKLFAQYNMTKKFIHILV